MYRNDIVHEKHNWPGTHVRGSIMVVVTDTHAAALSHRSPRAIRGESLSWAEV